MGGGLITFIPPYDVTVSLVISAPKSSLSMWRERKSLPPSDDDPDDGERLCAVHDGGNDYATHASGCAA